MPALCEVMLSVLEVVQKTTEFFTAKGVEHARFNAEFIVGHALGLKRMQLYLQFDRLLSDAELTKIRPLVKRRSMREPLAYVLGETEFYGLHLKSDPRALIPRPETEELVERCIKELKLREPSPVPLRFLDLGTGSGCIALALASAFPEARVLAVDASDEALALASENTVASAFADRVRLLKSDWFSAIPEAEAFDLIVANPPYLTLQETQETLPEVRNFEPHKALSSGEDGLDDLKKIIAAASRYLSPGALLAMETGVAQHSALLGLLGAAGFVRTESVKDLSGRDRIVLGWK
jgi:release factor glutamine methyltransferase